MGVQRGSVFLYVFVVGLDELCDLGESVFVLFLQMHLFLVRLLEVGDTGVGRREGCLQLAYGGLSVVWYCRVRFVSDASVSEESRMQGKQERKYTH
jgi:hypothetical protein